MTGAETSTETSTGRTGKTDLLWTALLLLLALLPLPFGANRPWAWSAMSLLVSLMLATWAIFVMTGRRPLVWRKALSVPLLAALLLVIWIVVTTLAWPASANPVWQLASDALGLPLPGRIALSVDAALVALMRMLAYVSVFWLSLQYCRDPKRSERLLIWVSWTGLAYALYGLVNYFAGNPYLLWYARFAGETDVTSTFVNRNHYATFAGLGLLCSIGLSVTAFRNAWQHSDRSQKTLPRTIECFSGRPLVYFVIMLIIGMSWLQSHSRMGAAAVLLGLLVMSLLMRGVRLIRGMTWLYLAISLFMLFLVSGNTTLERARVIGETDRYPLFSILLDQITSAPWTGSGYGSFSQAMLIYRDQRLSTATVFTQAHNGYLELAVELGTPAALLAVLAIGWCAALCLIGVFRRQRMQIYPIIAVAATVTVAAHALTDFSLQIPAVAALYAALLGMGVAQSWTARSSQ